MDPSVPHRLGCGHEVSCNVTFTLPMTQPGPLWWADYQRGNREIRRSLDHRRPCLGRVPLRRISESRSGRCQVRTRSRLLALLVGRARSSIDVDPKEVGLRLTEARTERAVRAKPADGYPDPEPENCSYSASNAFTNRWTDSSSHRAKGALIRSWFTWLAYFISANRRTWISSGIAPCKTSFPTACASRRCHTDSRTSGSKG